MGWMEGFYQHILPGLTCAAFPLLLIGLWTVLGWLGKAVWFTGWMLSWIGWLLSGCPCPKRSGNLGGPVGGRRNLLRALRRNHGLLPPPCLVGPGSWLGKPFVPRLQLRDQLFLLLILHRP